MVLFLLEVFKFMKRSLGQKTFDCFNIIFMVVLMLVMAYPLWHVIMASFSSDKQLMGHTGFILKPMGFNVNAYKLMMKDPMIIRGYANTIFLVVVGTSLNLLFTTIGAYFFSRKNVYWKKYLMMLIIFTMYFSGGLIPGYIMVAQVYGLKGSYLALILPGLISTYNLIIMRTSFMSIPESLIEAARIDGAGHWKVLFRIVVPTSMAAIAVITLYYAVGYWNSWFAPSIYLSGQREKFPLQLILREILISNDTTMMTQGSGNAGDQLGIAETVKHAVTVTATVPILLVYPFLQKYFVKGVMIGSVKE